MARPLFRGPSPAHQKGFALLLLLLLVAVVLSTFLIGNISPRAQTISADKITAASLAQAREALVGRAVNDDNRPGSLPCPDTNDDGVAELLVGNECPSYIGRLPWKTLGLTDIRDGSGERLWYALSRSLRDDNSAQPINSDTPGQLTVIGTSPAVNVAAVIFSPGPVLNAQIRDSANENNVANYLEGENADGNTTYASGLVSDTFNDRLLVLTTDALFQVVEYRVAREIRNSLLSYFASYGYYPYANSYVDNTYACTDLLTRGRIPNPADYAISATCTLLKDWPPGSIPIWFVPNNWHLLTYYSAAPGCTQPNSNSNCLGAGRLTVNGTDAPTNDKRALVIVAGRTLGGQTRPSSNVADYLDAAENTNLDDVYIKQAQSATFNDKIVVVAHD